MRFTPIHRTLEKLKRYSFYLGGDQPHVPWLDLTLGIGIPGVFLLVLAGVLAVKNALNVIPHLWSGISLWMLLSIALLMTTTEVSQQIYLDALVFLILWTAGLGLDAHLKHLPTKSKLNVLSY